MAPRAPTHRARTRRPRTRRSASSVRTRANVAAIRVAARCFPRAASRSSRRHARSRAALAGRSPSVARRPTARSTVRPALRPAMEPGSRTAGPIDPRGLHRRRHRRGRAAARRQGAIHGLPSARARRRPTRSALDSLQYAQKMGDRRSSSCGASVTSTSLPPGVNRSTRVSAPGNPGRVPAYHVRPPGRSIGT